MIVRIKFIPAETGITNVKFAEDKALNMTSAEAKMITKAPITCAFSKNWNHSLKELRPLPFNFHLMMAAPETFSRAYKKQNRTALIMLLEFYDFVDNK